MKTKIYILSALLLLFTGVASMHLNAFASGGGGGCSSCECTNTCEPDPECSNGATDYPACTTFPPIIEPPIVQPPIVWPPLPSVCENGAPNYPICTFTCENGATNYPACNNNVVNIKCLNKVLKEIPTSDKPIAGMCSSGLFFYTQSYNKTIGNFIQTFIEGRCDNNTNVAECEYVTDIKTCLNDTITCPDKKTILRRVGDACTFPACPENPKCAQETFTCPDGTILKRSGDSCEFPSCPVRPECPTDTFTCWDGEVLKRSGSTCTFSTCKPKPECPTDTKTCEDGTVVGRSGDTCEYAACPKLNVYTVGGVITSGDEKLGGVIVEIFKEEDTEFKKPLRQTETSDDGSYKITGLTPGGYIIKTNNKDDFVFLDDVKGIKITNTNALGTNFNAISKVKNTDPVVTEIIKNSITGGDPEITDWLQKITSGQPNENNSTIITTETTNQNTTNDDNVSKQSSNEIIPEEEIVSEDFGISEVTAVKQSFNPLSMNTLISLLEKGYTLENQSYSPISLSLVYKYANQNAICGNGVVEPGETCDEGSENGKPKKCSLDCLYIGEVRFSNLSSSSLKKSNKSSASGVVKNFKLLAQNTVGRVTALTDGVKDIITDHTSEKTRKVIKQVAEVAVETAKYSVVGVTTLLVATAGALNVMVFKSQWQTYTISEGDTFETIGSKFNMTERAIKRKNGIDKKKSLHPGMKIKVRNRAFIEKDYLNQLQFVLTDALKTRNHGHMAEKIEQMFAKKK